MATLSYQPSKKRAGIDFDLYLHGAAVAGTPAVDARLLFASNMRLGSVRWYPRADFRLSRSDGDGGPGASLEQAAKGYPHLISRWALLRARAGRPVPVRRSNEFLNRPVRHYTDTAGVNFEG